MQTAYCVFCLSAKFNRSPDFLYSKPPFLLPRTGENQSFRIPLIQYCQTNSYLRYLHLWLEIFGDMIFKFNLHVRKKALIDLAAWVRK